MTTRLTAGTMFADRYEILECLGRGGMGIVYSAQHSALAKKFAIKLLHRDLNGKDALTRFAQEARSASAIEHQNIIDVLDAGSINNVAFYVMEYLKGEDLQTLFTREAPLPWERVQRITLQICDAMQAAHDRRIIHRDLKPSNLYRITRGANTDFIKVLDFGIAKVRTADEHTRDGLTAVGSVLGTPKYMAPEQASGLKVDHRADIYSLGVIMYHALTGELPFKTRQSLDPAQVRRPELPTPMQEYSEGIPADVEALVVKALATDPSERFPSMHSLASSIERIKQIELPNFQRVPHGRGPFLEINESSVEFISDKPTSEVTDGTTRVHAPGPAPVKADGLAPYALPMRRAGPSLNEVVTQTGSPHVRRARPWRALAPWLPGVAVAGFLLLQSQPAAPLPTGGSPPERDPVVAQSHAAPEQQTPAPPPVLVMATPTAPETDGSLASNVVSGEPAILKNGDPPSTVAQARTKTRTHGRRQPAVTEPEVDCHTIREATLTALQIGDWNALYRGAGSACWANDSRTLEWRVKAKKELKEFTDCVRLGKNSTDPHILGSVKFCEARRLMEFLD